MISVATLEKLTGIRHGFFTRNGGVSTGVYTSMNCCLHSLDDPEAVKINRTRAMAVLDLPSDSLVTAQQRSTASVAVISGLCQSCRNSRLLFADALVTKLPGIVLGILSADCAPVLLADIHTGVVGGIHAGWRGALRGVIPSAIRAMRGIGATPANTVAVIGPCITQQFYEVNTEFTATFLTIDPGNAIFFIPSSRIGHCLFDLPGYITYQLVRCGVASVTRVSYDTFRDNNMFFSRRHSLSFGKTDYGRHLSVIARVDT